MQEQQQLPAHRRCRSDAEGLLDAVASGNLMPRLQGTLQASNHVRSVSLGSSASQFLQSLKLQDPAAHQHNLQHGGIDQESVPDQHSGQRMLGGTDGDDDAGMAALAAGAAGGNAGTPGAAAAQDAVGAGKPARGKRAHRSSNNRASQSAMQVDVPAHEEQAHGFTPLPAVVEDGLFDSERDWDSDSDREGVGPHRRGSKAGNRRGGYNGRSESELMLLDPKRVKRILANRESAARSKERRMNYTTELEGKLQVLGSESDKLRSQLNNLSKQEGKLTATKADLEHQVKAMHVQVNQVVSDNQALMSTLFQLQAAMGLPQMLPDHIMPSSTHSGTYQQSWQAYQQQADASTQPTSPKPRKPRQRQSKHHHQQLKQHKPPPAAPAAAGAGWDSSYAGSVEADMSDPAAAAAAPVAELPVNIRPRSSTAVPRGNAPAAVGAASSAAVAAAHGASVSASPTAAAAAAVAAAAATGTPMGLCGTQGAAGSVAGVGHGSGSGPPALHVPSRQHQWHTGLGGSSTPHSSSSMTGQQQAPGSTQRMGAVSDAGPAADVAVRSTHGGTPGGLGCSGLLPLHQQQQQQLPPGVDALMGDADDDVAMLGAFLEVEGAFATLATPAALAAHRSPPSATAAAAAGAVPHCTEGAPYGIECEVAAVASTTTGAAGAAAAGLTVVTGLSAAMGRPAARLGSNAVQNHNTPAAPAAVRPGGGFMLRRSPALSDPVGVEYWPDDISSGSVGGSLTHSHTPNNLTPNMRHAAEGVNGVGPAYTPPPGGWQQQQKLGTQQVMAAAAGAASGMHGAGICTQPAAAAAGGVGSGCGAVWCSGPPSGAGSMTSPLTPVSGRVSTPSATAAAAAAGAAGATVSAGVTAMTGSTGPAAVAGVGSQQQYTPSFAAGGFGVAGGFGANSLQHQQQQQQLGVELSPTQLSGGFGVGGSPGPQQWSAARHIRSASTGCVSALGWQGCDQFALPATFQHMQQQQQVTQAVPQQLQGGGERAAAGAVTTAAQFSSAVPGVGAAGGMMLRTVETSLEVHSVRGPPASAGSSASWQRHRRSHSHGAAAFMSQGGLTQFELSVTQQQQHVMYGMQQQQQHRP